MTKEEFNKSANSVNNKLDYNLDDIRFELRQIYAVLHYAAYASLELVPNDDTQNISDALFLARNTLKRTHNRLEVLLGIDDKLI